jgi:hypothetical protein
MPHLRHRVVVDESRLDAVHHQQVHHLYLVYLIYTEMMMVRHQCVVEILHQLMGHLMQDAVRLVVRQILDEQNLDEILPFLDVVPQFPEGLQIVAVDAEPHHLLKMDCYLGVEDAEPHHLLKMDCYLDEVQVILVLTLQVRRFLLHDLLLRSWQLPLY